MADSGPPKGVFDEISVKRINIVEPDGQYRLVLSTSERFPGLFMEGKEYKHHTRGGGEMLFFYDKGDDVGRLTFSSKTVAENTPTATGNTSGRARVCAYLRDPVVPPTIK